MQTSPPRLLLPIAGSTVYVKKLGRIPDGGGHRKLGPIGGKHNNERHGVDAGIGGESPIDRVRVHNVTEKNS